MRAKTTLCRRCKAVPKETGSYCKPCKNFLQRTRYATLRNGPPISRANKGDPRLCGCRDPRCNGLTCDSIRYGTAI